VTDLFDAPPPEPFAPLRRWVEEARSAGVGQPLAVTLATAGADGHETSRIVVLRGIDDDAVTFTSVRTGTKGAQIAANPWASVTAFWPACGRQVNLAGPVTEVEGEVADAMWAAQPWAAQVATALSVQGAVLDDEEDLRRRVWDRAVAGGEIARPADWVAYRVAPEHVELWQTSPDDRLHRRLRYVRVGGDGAAAAGGAGSAGGTAGGAAAADGTGPASGGIGGARGDAPPHAGWRTVRLQP
jgi:pyridoxamine 5'-phosphate oxidase